MLNDQHELSNLTNSQLEQRLKSCVEKELEMKIEILHLLREVEKRRLYSRTYPSLFEYCIKELKYSAASAQRRIDTMRAMKQMPEIEEKLQSGTLQLSTVARVQSFFRHEAKAGKSYTLENKRAVLAKVENKSSRECEKELVSISPQSARPDVRREICVNKTELRVTLNDELVKKLDYLKSLLSNKYPHLTDTQLIEVLADMVIKKLDPSEKSVRGKSNKPKVSGAGTSQLPTSEVGSAVKRDSISRYVPAAIRQEVWMRDRGRCTHPGCNSNHRLQYDHILPIAKGGETTVTNLRLLCQTHNLLAARREFGEKKISDFIRKKTLSSVRVQPAR